MLAHFIPNFEICLQTNASDFARGAVLVTWPSWMAKWSICYASKTLDRAQANYLVTEKECLAVVWSTDLFRTLLLGHQFVLSTDHSALKQLLTNKTTTGRQAQWAMKLQEFDMTVFHRKREEQGNADFMSRLIHNPDGTFTVNWFETNTIL